MTSLAGAIILKDINKTVLFKNRDLERGDFKEEIFYDIDCFGIRGLDRNSGSSVGLGIGVNRYGLAVANTHVLASSNPSYDILTEQILMFAKDAEDGLAMTVDHLKKGRQYQWGNLVLADSDSMLVIEIADGEHSIEWSERKVLRTGHHIMLDTEDEIRKNSEEFGLDSYYDDSSTRFNRGYELLRGINNMNAVFSLLQDHGDAPGQNSICKHSTSSKDLGTAASYVIEVDHEQDTGRPKIVFHVCRGNPCETDFVSVPLIFPADEDIMKRAREMFFR